MNYQEIDPNQIADLLVEAGYPDLRTDHQFGRFMALCVSGFLDISLRYIKTKAEEREKNIISTVEPPPYETQEPKAKITQGPVVYTKEEVEWATHTINDKNASEASLDKAANILIAINQRKSD